MRSGHPPGPEGDDRWAARSLQGLARVTVNLQLRLRPEALGLDNRGMGGTMGITIHNLLGSSMFRPMSLSLLGEPEGVIHCRNEQIRSSTGDHAR